MNNRRKLFQLGLVLLVALSLAPRSRAQDASSETQGIDSGNYNIRQTVEAGYRANEISGNMDSYDTFVNLASGVRLFDYTLDMRALNHQGLVFDDLYFNNFGYGGDPDDVSRLHIDKNKWYDFRLLFRRHKNFWDYNLWANPFNPATLNPPGSLTTGCYVGPTTAAFPQGAPAYCSTPAIGLANSAHALDLVRRMQDYDLTLLPQSRVRFRLGFSHYRNEGPGFLTGDIGGSVPDFPEFYNYTTNAYRAGVDFHVLTRTTISYDQFLNYFRQDNVALLSPAATPASYGYQLANGTPVNLGIVWSTQTPAESLPCAYTAASPILSYTTTPPTVVKTACNGYISYSQVGKPRNFMPTERLRFQSNYFEKFEMNGSVGYSTSDNSIPNFNETVIGWITRTSSPGGTTAGPATVKRVSVDGDWSGVYSVTDKFRIEDFFHYNNWRIPGLWDSVAGTFFNTTAGTGLGAPIGAFVAANCDLANSYSGPTCPNHTAASGADVADAYNWNFLKQDMKTNTFQLDYDFTKRVKAFIGYLYDHREIVYSTVTYTTEDIYYPGGTTLTATAANDYLAARGNCALVAGVLPATCVLNANGSITYKPAIPTTPPVFEPLGIDEHALLFGMKVRPVDSLSITGDLSIGYNDAAFTRIDPRQVQSYKVHVAYTPKPWATLDGAVEIHENRDNVEYVNNLEHDRSYSVTTMLVPTSRVSVGFGYNYWDVYTQSGICFNYSVTPTTLTLGTSPPGVATTACPISGASVGAAGLGTLSTYAGQDHFAHADLIWKPVKRVTTAFGYGGSFVRGNTIFLNPLAPSGTLDYDYQIPYGSIAIDLYKGFTYKTVWNYYGFNQKGNTSPFGLAAIPLQDFNGSNVTVIFRYAF